MNTTTQNRDMMRIMQQMQQELVQLRTQQQNIWMQQAGNYINANNVRPPPGFQAQPGKGRGRQYGIGGYGKVPGTARGPPSPFVRAWAQRPEPPGPAGRAQNFRFPRTSKIMRSCAHDDIVHTCACAQPVDCRLGSHKIATTSLLSLFFQN